MRNLNSTIKTTTILKSEGSRLETDGKLVFEKGYHASGHASVAELLKIVEDIDPEIVLPVHTEDSEFFVDNLKGYDVVLAEEGKGIEIK